MLLPLCIDDKGLLQTGRKTQKQTLVLLKNEEFYVRLYEHTIFLNQCY